MNSECKGRAVSDEYLVLKEAEEEDNLTLFGMRHLEEVKDKLITELLAENDKLKRENNNLRQSYE